MVKKKRKQQKTPQITLYSISLPIVARSHHTILLKYTPESHRVTISSLLCRPMRIPIRIRYSLPYDSPKQAIVCTTESHTPLREHEAYSSEPSTSSSNWTPPANKEALRVTNVASLVAYSPKKHPRFDRPQELKPPPARSATLSL